MATGRGEPVGQNAPRAAGPDYDVVKVFWVLHALSSVAAWRLIDASEGAAIDR